jgi:HK97 family phage major capsid protein
MDLTEIKGLIVEQNRLAGEFRAKVDQELAEIKARGAAMPDTKAAIEAMNTRFDEIESKLARTAQQLSLGRVDSPAVDTDEKKAFAKFLRFGTKGGACFDHMSAEEKTAFHGMRQKALANTSDAGGGFFVPEDFQATVIKKIANVANVSALVSHQATSRDVLRWPTVKYTTDDIDNSALAMTWEDESDSVTTTDPTPLGSVSIQVKRARGLVLVDRELLEDSAVDVLSLLSSLIADKASVDLDRQYTIGPGGKRPEGFMTNADISTTNSGSSGAFTFDGLMDLVHAVPEQYVADGTFMLKRLSMGLIRKLKDTTNRPIWEPSQQAGLPATLLGYRLKTNEHIAAAAAASRSAIFANFKQLYMVADKSGLAIQRLDEKYADADQVGFIFRLRTGGAVVAPWAGRIQVLS